MNPQLGYRLDRINTLDHHTRRAIEELRRIRCTDPLAAAAITAIRRTQHSLEQEWMPLIADIQQSDAMVTWANAATGFLGTLAADVAHWFDGWFVFGGDPANPFRTMSDDELIEEVIRFDLLWPRLENNEFADARDGHDTVFDDARAAVLERVGHDDEFSRRLLAEAGNTATVGEMVARGGFPVPFSAAVLRQLLDPDDSSLLSFPEQRRMVPILDGVFAQLTPHPDAVLDLLVDPEFLAHLVALPTRTEFTNPSGWTSTIEPFLFAGLVEATQINRSRFGEGVVVVTSLIAHANTAPYDHGGFPQAIAAGVAMSIGWYVPGFVSTIAATDTHLDRELSRVQIDSDDDGEVDADLGTYEDLTDFFGALMYDAAAIGHLGIMLGDSAAAAAHGSLRIADVAELAALLHRAATNESAEATLDAVAAAAHRQQWLGALKLAVDVGGTVFTPISAVGSVVKRGTDVVRFIDSLADDEPDVSATINFGATAAFIIRFEIIRSLAHDPDYRQAHDVPTTQREWDDVAELFAELDAAEARGADEAETGLIRERILGRAHELGSDPVLAELDANPTLVVIQSESNLRD